MDVLAILALVEKGLTVIGALVSAERTAQPAIEALIGIISGAKKGTVTTEELGTCEALLDSLIADFNQDLPPEVL